MGWAIYETTTTSNTEDSGTAIETHVDVTDNKVNFKRYVNKCQEKGKGKKRLKSWHKKRTSKETKFWYKVVASQ